MGTVLLVNYCSYFLLSQVILASLEQGVREGRMLLHDWLVILTAQYNDVCKIVQFDHKGPTTVNIDVSFSQCPQLQPLPRLVFALLRNPLLRFHEEGVHPDYRIYLQCLFRYIMFVHSEIRKILFTQDVAKCCFFSLFFPLIHLLPVCVWLVKEKENTNKRRILVESKPYSQTSLPYISTRVGWSGLGLLFCLIYFTNL